MASIYTTVDVDVDIEIDEFVDSCSERELQMLVRYLQEVGYLDKSNIRDESKMTSNEFKFFFLFQEQVNSEYQHGTIL